VISDGLIWLTTATEEGNDLYAICVDAETGKVRFNNLVFHTDQPEPLGNGKGMNCYATPTPLLEKAHHVHPFRQPLHRLPRRAHGQGALEARGPEVPALPRPLVLRDLVSKKTII
jgi:hypothetical protein